MIKTHLASNGEVLVWDDELGMGYLPSNLSEHVYDKSYWDNYQKLKSTDIGKRLTKARIDLCKSVGVNPATCIDIGIGNGQFVEEFGCIGSDINPHAIEWLKSIGKYGEVHDDYGFIWYTLWDVIEHIEPNIFEGMLKYNHRGVVLSTPIYSSFEDCISSKHFKPGEHILYFTTHGIIRYMEKFGYKCIKMTTDETKVGRHNIGSFVFIKIDNICEYLI